MISVQLVPELPVYLGTDGIHARDRGVIRTGMTEVGERESLVVGERQGLSIWQQIIILILVPAHRCLFSSMPVEAHSAFLYNERAFLTIGILEQLSNEEVNMIDTEQDILVVFDSRIS